MMHALSSTSSLAIVVALASCSLGLAGCSAPWSSTKPAAAGSTASNPISADGSPAQSPVKARAGTTPVANRSGPFPWPWQGTWRGSGTDHMTDGSVIPFSMELTVAASTNPEATDPNAWVWAVKTNADLSTAGPSGSLRPVDAAGGKWSMAADGDSADAWFAGGTLSVHGTRGDLREMTIYRLDREGDREYIDVERTIETPRAVAGTSPLGTSGLHPGAVLRARLWRVEVTPEEAAQPK
jgi:hypothetical protein